MPSEPEPPSRTEGDLALPEGLEAGLLAGLVVAAVYAIHDGLAGRWLYTPIALGTLLIEGPEAARRGFVIPDAAMIFHAVHFVAWTAIGFAASALMAWAGRDRSRRLRVLLGLGFALVGGAAALDLGVRGSNLGRLHLWLGSAAGVITLLGFLAWRHPENRRRRRGQGAGPGAGSKTSANGAPKTTA